MTKAEPNCAACFGTGTVTVPSGRDGLCPYCHPHPDVGIAQQARYQHEAFLRLGVEGWNAMKARLGDVIVSPVYIDLWLTQPNNGFGGRSPIQVVAEEGIGPIDEMLYRVCSGDPS
jgi:hypothetical protein